MGKPTGVCGIELGKDAIALVHYIPDERTITSVGIQPLDDSSASHSWWDRVRSEIKPLIHEVRPNDRPLNGTPAICSIPAEHATLTRLMVDTAETDIGEILRWELSQQLLGAIEEYAYDFQKLTPLRPGPVSSYLAAACRASWAHRVHSLLRSQHLKPEALDLDVCALVNAFEINYHEVLSTPTLLIYGGGTVTKVVLTWNGGIVDFEWYRFATESEDAEGYVRMLQKAIGRLTTAYPSLASRSSLPGFTTGVVFTWDKFASACFRSLTNIQMLNPFRAINCTGLPESSLRLYAPRLAIAVGLAVRGTEEETET